MTLRATVLLLTVPTLTTGAWGQAPEGVGKEFQVNSYTTDDQRGSSVAADADGNFIVVWESDGSNGTDTSGFSIQGQRYDASGTPVGSEFQVNSYTTDDQRGSLVAADAQGNFVAVWHSDGSYGPDTSGFSIQGQRYDASGNSVGSQFQVNSYTTSDQWRPVVASDAGGDFVVVWYSYGSYGTDSSQSSIQGQLYDASGARVGSQFQVNSYTTSYQLVPAVATDVDGNFAVTWSGFGSYGTDTSGLSIQGQRYDASGTRVGSQFQVNSYTTSHQATSRLAMDAQGGFVVVWHSRGSYGTDSSSHSTQGQRYDASGTPVGGEFQVNSYTTSGQWVPAVAIGSDGNFVVAWESDGSDGTDTSSWSAQGQRYDASGTPVGPQFQVNSYTTDQQYRVKVMSGSDGNFVVVWESYGSDGTDTSYLSVQGLRYSTETIFTDGFESGDSSAWSSTVQ